MKMKTAIVLAAAAVGACAGLAAFAAEPQISPTMSAEIEKHRDAAKSAVGTEFNGTLSSICIATDSVRGPPPRTLPPRSEWYAKPYKVFDNLYFVGTKVHSAWALTTTEGIILIDTLFDYAVEPEIVQGLTTLGLDPKTIKYVIISHGHGDHDEGAKLLQDRYGARVVLGAPDWDLVARTVNKPGGIARKDIAAVDGQKITLGDTSVTLITTPGHTPGTLSMIFQVKDGGRPLTVAYSGGTAFNFPHTKANFDTYIASQAKFAKAAADAGATILMSNHTQFDGAYDKARIAQVPRAAGEPHPYVVGAPAVGSYFKMMQECALAAKVTATP